MSDIKTIQKEYEATQAKLEKLAEDLKAAEAQKFSSLPEQVGLKTVDGLIKALIPYASGVTKGKLRAAFEGKAKQATPKAGRASKRKPRARLDATARAQIAAALKTGDKTAAAVASEFGVSVATVNLIKKAEGLTKKRK